MLIRPFQMPTDGQILATLLPRCFQYPENPEWSLEADEIEDEAEQLARIQRMWPVFRALMLVVPPLRDAMLGFIAEDEGQAIGCINVSRQGSSDTWIIGNVAVLPSHRRRGIARQLVEAALTIPRSRDAHAVVLDVIAGNTPAYQLYRSLGFEHYDATDNYQLPADCPNPPATLLAGLRLVELNLKEWRVRFEHDQRITPTAVQRYRPFIEKNYRQPPIFNLFMPVLMRLLGQSQRLWGVYDGERLVARVMLSTSRNQSGVHHLRLSLGAEGIGVAGYLLRYATEVARAINPTKRIELEATGRVDGLQTVIEATGYQFRYRYERLGLLLGNHDS